MIAPIILVLVVIAALLLITSGVWVAIALVKAISSPSDNAALRCQGKQKTNKDSYK